MTASRWSGDFAPTAGIHETIWFSSLSNFWHNHRWFSSLMVDALSAMGCARPRLDIPPDFVPTTIVDGIPMSMSASTSHCPPLSISIHISHWYFVHSS